MTSSIETVADDVAVQPAPRTTKSSIVMKLLSRNRGATIVEIMAITHWQSHSTRAFLTSLRKKGLAVLKEVRKDGETNYRLRL